MGGVVLNADGTEKTPFELKVRREHPPLFSRFFPLELQHATDSRNAACDAVVDLVDAGSTNSEGRIRIYTAGKISLLATVLMANPAFSAAVTGVAAGAGLPWSDLAASASGTAAEFDMIDRDENIILTGDVALSGEEMSFPQLEIAVNDIVKILTCSYTAAP